MAHDGAKRGPRARCLWGRLELVEGDPLLLAKGLRVTSVAIPLTSYADDVAAKRRAIATQDGPTLIVGHSYGGVVITEAGNEPKVTGLVYVAAFAPDANKSIGAKTTTLPASHAVMLAHAKEVAQVILDATG